jgi:hypothetical protein
MISPTDSIFTNGSRQAWEIIFRNRCFPTSNRFNPKSEIETSNLPQSLGHKRIEKISTDHFGYASIFSIRFCSKILRHLTGLNFGFRVQLYAGIHPKRFGYHRLLSKRFPYAVYYDQEGTLARVWAVLDSRRDPKVIRARLAGLRRR